MEPLVEELEGWTIYMVLIFDQQETNITVLGGTVLVELGEDYVTCCDLDSNGEAARLFRDAKLLAARQEISKAVKAARVAAKTPEAKKPKPESSDPVLSSTVRERAEERVAQLRREEALKAQRAEKWEELQEPIYAEIKQWARGRRNLQAVLVGLQEILPDTELPFDVEAVKAGTTGDSTCKKAYMKMLKILHPDKIVNQPMLFQIRATGVFQVVKKAYEKSLKT